MNHQILHFLHESANRYRKFFKRKNRKADMCLFPGCSQRAIRAHSISKSTCLQSISRESHVLWTHFDYRDNLLNSGSPPLKREGVMDATTFHGFCNAHDGIFIDIDLDPHLTSKKAIFLHAYRTLAREYWWQKSSKMAFINAVGEAALRSFPSPNPIPNVQGRQTLLDGYSFQIYTIGRLKELFDQAILTENWDIVRGYEISFKQSCPIANAIGHLGDFTFDGRALQTPTIIEHPEAPLIFMLILPTVESCKFISVWHEKTDRFARPFIQSLDELPDDRKSDALLRFFFLQYGNLAISEEWWFSLPSYQRTYLSDIMYLTMDSGQMQSYQLADMGIRIADWGVASSKFIN